MIGLGRRGHKRADPGNEQDASYKVAAAVTLLLW
jgi:hypothetical protein